MRYLLSALLLIPTLLSLPAVAAEKAVPASPLQIQLSFAPVVRRAAPAVVNIFSRSEPPQAGGTGSALRSNPSYRRYLGDEEEHEENSLGSGVIVDPNGTIVTNRHVIEDATDITVALNDRREFAARLVRADDRTDLAVLKIDDGGEALPYLEIRDSDELEVGDIVLAIGNPFGVGQTVTSGIVSALARNVGGINAYRTFIQTDAAINPGNSGGALVSLDGRLVGINAALYSEGGGSVGIGFAIPSALIRGVLGNGVAGARIVRPWLGVIGRSVTAAAAKKLGLARPIGVAVEQVVANSPAAEAGVEPGDVVLGVDGKPIEDEDALRFRFATLTIGTSAKLSLWRDGAARQFEVRLTAPPEKPPRNVTQLKAPAELAGITVASLSPALAEELEADPVPGVIVLDVPRASQAARLGLSVGDILQSVDGQAVTTVGELQRAHGSMLPLAVRRDGRVLRLPRQ